LTEVGNPLLSERDGNLITNKFPVFDVTVGNPLLSERDGNSVLPPSAYPCPKLIVGNPLLSERDGNILAESTFNPAFQSETHYSLKEMETLSWKVLHTLLPS